MTMEAPARLRLARREAGDVLVLEVAGDLVLGEECRLLQEEMYGVFGAEYSKVLLNLSQLRRVDSSGIGVLLAAKTSALRRNVQLKVCSVPPFVAGLLDRARLTSILEVYEEEAAALATYV